MQTCPKCMAKNLNNAKICDSCGASLGEQSKQEKSNNTYDQNELAKQLKALNETISSIELNSRNSRNVIISDINMTFKSMIEFMVKWAIAAIPAAIILFTLTQQLRNSTIDWKLTENDSLEVKLNWLRRSVRNAKKIEQKYYSDKKV